MPHTQAPAAPSTELEWISQRFLTHHFHSKRLRVERCKILLFGLKGSACLDHGVDMKWNGDGGGMTGHNMQSCIFI